jgi:predicted Zn-dependent peptidase
VQQAGLAGDVTGGINLLGNMFDYEGPMLWIGYLYHDRNTSDVEILRVVDATIDSLMTVLVDPAVLARARVKARAQLYATLGDVTGGEADILASYALFDNDPSRVNTIDSSFAAVTPALIQRTAQEYLRPTNRTVLTVLPGKAGDATVVQ